MTLRSKLECLCYLILRCLENPRDGGVWWAAVYGIAQSQTRLKWLSSSSSSRDLLEKEMATNSSMFAWKISWMEETGRLVHGVAKSQTWLSDFVFTFHFHALEKEMVTNPLHCSCLENPRDWGAWWAAVCGVAQSQTWLKWLSSSSRDL